IRDYTFVKLSCTRGRQGKKSRLRLLGDMDVAACTQPRLSPGGVLVLATSVGRPTRLMVSTRRLGIACVLFDSQAACAFRCSASKRPPSFQSVNVMAAILRA